MSGSALIFCLFSPILFSQEKLEKPVTLRAGIFITQIAGLSSSKDSFHGDFWVWFNYPGKPTDYFSKIEFCNALETKQTVRDTEEQLGVIWDTAKYSSKVAAMWGTSNFPFDKHKLEIQMESIRPISEMIFEPDISNSGFSSLIQLDGWKVLGKSLRVEKIKYETNFGSLVTGPKEEFSRLILSIEVGRDDLSLFFKLHAGVYVAFAITILSFFMNPGSDDIFSGRVSLIVGMLFASLVNLQIVANTIGQTTTLSLSDKIHIYTMINLLFSIGFTFFSRKQCEKGNQQFAWKFDRYCLSFQALAYLMVNAILILQAIYS